MGYRFIRLEREGDVATLTLDRPNVLNAISTAMMDEVAAALGEASKDGVRALVLTGAGRGFCAGQNLAADREEAAAGPREMAMRHYWPVFEGLRDAPYPTIAAVNGIAAGAGFSLALGCDLILAARSATFVQIFGRVGLIPDLGSTYWLPRLLGRHRALAAMLTTEPIASETARDWGFVHDVVDDERLSSEAAALASKLAAGPTQTYVATRKAVDSSYERDFKSQFDYEMTVQAEIAASEDAREGIAAFLEKRPARFKGG